MNKYRSRSSIKGQERREIDSDSTNSQSINIPTSLLMQVHSTSVSDPFQVRSLHSEIHSHGKVITTNKKAKKLRGQFNIMKV